MNANALDTDLASTLKLRREESMVDQIEAFGHSIARLRDEAVTARKASGIEDVWLRCEESYLGIDDVNRSEFSGQAWAKPMTMDAPLVRETADGQEGSTVFVKLTSRYVDASAARMGDILLPIDDKPFTCDSTPIPELDKAVEDSTPVGIPNPENPQMPLTVADLAARQIDRATEKAKASEKRMWDWLTECNFGGEIRKVIHDASRLGVGVIKGPVPVVKKVRRALENALSWETQIKPGSMWVDPWNLYPDGACGENIQDGSYLWEHDTMSAKQLQNLMGQDGYLTTQLKKVLKEGPGKRNALGAQSYNQSEEGVKHKYDVWHFYGRVARRDLMTVDAVGLEGEGDDDDQIDAILTLVNDSVVRATLNPIESGEFPYDTMSWKRRSGHWAGVGVAEDLFTPQRMINGATRRMNDNAGLSAGIQVVVDRGAIYPEDGSWRITPNKIWSKSDESGNTDVRNAFQTFTIPSVQGELMNIIQYALRLAEESAGLPLVAQGQQSGNPTLGQDQLQNTNANTMMRRVAKSFDDGITTPHINRYYDWLMMDPSVPDEEKGDMQIVVHGSSALVERSIQDQSIREMGPMIQNPAFRIDPAKWFAEMCRGKFLDPKRVQYTDEEFEKVKAEMQPPPMPQVEVAKIRAQADAQKTQALIQADQQKTQAELQVEREIAQIENQTAQTRIQVDTDRDTVLVQAQAQKNQADYQARMQELQVKRELALLEYANTQKLTLEQIKSDLARDAMKLNVQKELAGAAHAIDVHKHHNPQVIKPAVEPAGRAAPGQAFTQ